MIYACIVVGITALLIYKKGFRRTRSIGTQTPLKALLNRSVQTDEYCLYGLTDSESSEVGMNICSTYFGYASDDDSFFSVLEYSNNEHETSNQSGNSDPPPSTQQPQHLP